MLAMLVVVASCHHTGESGTISLSMVAGTTLLMQGSCTTSGIAPSGSPLNGHLVP